MINPSIAQPQRLQDQFGRRVAARLTAGTAELPYSAIERLRAARVRAMAKRKLTHLKIAPSVVTSDDVAVLTFDGRGPSLWNRLGSALPLLALAAGLILIHTIQNDRRASELAEVDAALLTDDLPPSAYADPGFIQFLKSSRE